MVPQKPIEVAAGILINRYRVLLGKRPTKGKYPHQWEFPGGKVEPGETPQEALHRELKEELEISARIGQKIISYKYTYPNRHQVNLTFYLITHFTPDPQKIHHSELQWVPVDKLRDYNILEGSRKVVNFLLTHGQDLFNGS